MLSRYVVSLTALVDGELKNQILASDYDITREQMIIMLQTVYPDAEKYLGTCTLISIRIPESLN